MQLALGDKAELRKEDVQNGHFIGFLPISGRLCSNRHHLTGHGVQAELLCQVTLDLPSLLTPALCPYDFRDTGQWLCQSFLPWQALNSANWEPEGTNMPVFRDPAWETIHLSPLCLFSSQLCTPRVSLLIA